MGGGDSVGARGGANDGVVVEGLGSEAAACISGGVSGAEPTVPVHGLGEGGEAGRGEADLSWMEAEESGERGGDSGGPRCRHVHRHWAEMLCCGPKNRYWALECQPKAGHWLALVHWSASRFNACVLETHTVS